MITKWQAVEIFVYAHSWLVVLAIGLPIFAAIEWLRRRRASPDSALEWRFIASMVLACAVTPVYTKSFLPHLYPAILFVQVGVCGLVSAPKGAKLELNMLLYGALHIAVMSVVLCGVWSLFAFIRRIRK